MNIRTLLVAAALTVTSGAAFAGKAPVVLGGFQTSGTVIIPAALGNAVGNASGDKGSDKGDEREEKK